VLVAAVVVAGCGRIPDQSASGAGSSGTASPGSGSSSSAQHSSVRAKARSDGSSSGSAKAHDCSYTRTGKPARKVNLPPSNHVPMHGRVHAVIEMTSGKIGVQLDRSRAPCTVNSFVSLAKQGFYDKTSCPRLTSDAIYILQCGDPTGTGHGGPGYSFPDELSGDEKYPAGTVAMANSGPNSNGSQFFLVYRKSKIDPKYTVFGTMDKPGRKVLSKIAAQGDDGSNPNGGGKPKANAKIISVSVH
jgi:peptidyl-prolyl cis-trans isomerase B (cyclophilin B)